MFGETGIAALAGGCVRRFVACVGLSDVIEQALKGESDHDYAVDITIGTATAYVAEVCSCTQGCQQGRGLSVQLGLETLGFCTT